MPTAPCRAFLGDKMTEKLARMAGFVNGEGTFCLNDGVHACFSVTQQNDTEDLNLFVEEFGGRLYSTEVKGGIKYTYQTGKLSQVYLIYKTLQPWLSTVKKNAAIRAIGVAREYRDEMKENRKSKAECGTRARYQRGCRCFACTKASREYMMDYRWRKSV